MACTIFLVRHGIAESGHSDLPDADRELTSAGEKKMRQIGDALRRLDVAPQAILSSPLKRAIQTARIISECLEGAAAKELAPLEPGGGSENVVAALQAHQSATQIILVGHQPDMGELASYLVTGSEGLAPLPFKKGGVAAIEVAAVPPSSPGSLLWFLTPKQLRLISGSD